MCYLKLLNLLSSGARSCVQLVDTDVVYSCFVWRCIIVVGVLLFPSTGIYFPL